MDNDTRNLLIGIGQPGFPYRRYDEDDAAALLAKWPLLERIAGERTMRATPLAGRRLRPESAPGSAGQPDRANRGEQKGFLAAYDTAAPGTADPTADVRSLFDRLSGDRA